MEVGCPGVPTCSQLLALEGPVELQALQLAGPGLGVGGLVEDVVSGLRVLGPGQVQLRHQLQPDVHLTLPVAGAVRRVQVCTADTFIVDNIHKLSIDIPKKTTHPPSTISTIWPMPKSRSRTGNIIRYKLNILCNL